jgi:hypothetical protein
MQSTATSPIDHNLTDVQYNVLNYLASGLSISEATRAAGVQRNTVTNWRYEVPGFAALFQEALAERAIIFREQADALVGKALAALRAILIDDEASASVRLRAALAVLKMAPIAQPEESKPQKQTPANRPQVVAKPEKLHNPAQRPAQNTAETDSRKPCPCGSQVRYGLCCSPDSPVHASRFHLQAERKAAQPVHADKMPENEICGVEK